MLFLPALFLFFVESTLDTNFKLEGKYQLFLLPGLFEVIQDIVSWIYVLNNTEGSIHAFLTGRGKHFTIEGIGIVFSLIFKFGIGQDGDYFGADMKTRWYNRNLRILQNIYRVIDSTDDMVLIDIGSGHLPILRNAIISSPELELVEIMEYLN